MREKEIEEWREEVAFKRWGDSVRGVWLRAIIAILKYMYLNASDIDDIVITWVTIQRGDLIIPFHIGGGVWSRSVIGA